MTIQEALEKFRSIQTRKFALSYAAGSIWLDGVTTAPSDTAEGRGVALGEISELAYPLTAGEEIGQLLAFLSEHAEELDPLVRREVELAKEDYDEVHVIPQEDYVAWVKLTNESEDVWHKAKAANDWPLFRPYLGRIIEGCAHRAACINPEKPAYDTLLDQYEKGLTMEILDSFFARLREGLVPLLQRVMKSSVKIDDSFLFRDYPVEDQRRFSDYLMDVMHIDRSHCGIGETEHPFTMSFDRKNARITTHYFTDNVASSMYSVIHEGGHALYEMGFREEYKMTALSSAASMALHESQSRMYENMIGRSRAFIELIFPKMQEFFPTQLSDVTSEQFYLAVNRVQPSLIRTEADELTYSLHIMIRYEIEKMMMNGTLDLENLPKIWAEKVHEYLGIEVPTDREGVLQDSHWGSGSIGYFPSYALGNAYAAQFMARMKMDLDVDDLISHGKTDVINAWLDEHIHQYGRLYTPSALFAKVCEAPFDAQYYIDYLVEKYSKIYEL